MAVPDTTTFNLQTVVNVVNPTSDDLPSCFSNAVSNKFNATYKAQYYAAAGDKNNLLMFRDYDSGVSNLLTVEATSSASGPVILIQNYQNITQTITYTWQYVSQTTNDSLATVQYGGTTRAVGYTTATITASLSGSNYAFYHPFSISGGNDATVTFKLVLLTAATDTVPSSPNNAASYTVCVNC
jgi:hypothetical protein